MARYEGRHRTAETETTKKRRGPADRPARSTDSASAARPAAWGSGPSASNLERAAANRRDSRSRPASWHRDSRPHEEDWDHEAAAPHPDEVARRAASVAQRESTPDPATREHQAAPAQSRPAQPASVQPTALLPRFAERGSTDSGLTGSHSVDAREREQGVTGRHRPPEHHVPGRHEAGGTTGRHEAAGTTGRHETPGTTGRHEAAGRAGRHEQAGDGQDRRGGGRGEAPGHAVPQGPGVSSSAPTPQTRRALRPPKKRNVARPVLASTLALGLGASGFAYAKSANLIGADTAAFVVGSGVVAQTDELARAATVDTTYRAAASVSRNERRTAIAATGLRTAKELEAKKKAEAARKAAEAREAERRAELERERKRAIANARNDPKSAARVLMLDHGWTSDAQYNCLVNLWTGESGWRWNAENASSGAYGIPQSLPASKMSQFGSDYRTNPITQIRWGLWYIDMSYGNPCNAWSTWQARSPHWY